MNEMEMLKQIKEYIKKTNTTKKCLKKINLKKLMWHEKREIFLSLLKHKQKDELLSRAEIIKRFGLKVESFRARYELPYVVIAYVNGRRTKLYSTSLLRVYEVYEKDFKAPRWK